MLNQSVTERVLQAALGNGADFAELFFEDSVVNLVETIRHEVRTAAYTRLHGAGVRVLLGTRSAYAYSADTSEKALIETAKAAAAALADAPKATQIVFAARTYQTPETIPFASVQNDQRVALLLAANAEASRKQKEVTQVMGRYTDKVQHVLIANSEGAFVTDVRPRTRAFIECVAMDGTQAQTGYHAPGCCRGFEAYDNAIDVLAAARTAADVAVTMLHAPDCPAGYLPVVIDGGFGGVIFHEACGHSLEATQVGRGNSEFCGKLGQKVATDCVSAIDDGTLENEWGSINVDDEGYLPRRNVLIEKGVLKGYMIDRLGSRRMGMAPTGSSRRQGYTYAPTSRMTNTFIAPGTDDEEEMIRGIDEGLYAKKMAGGSVNPATGEFNFTVAEGYWIRDGKIHCPVRGAALVGRGTEVLQKIDRVGPRMWMAQGMCGSVSGSVPTNVGQPRIRVTGITVGGKGGKLQ